MKNILIIGCGSIGARHARNARALGLDVTLVDPDNARAQGLKNEIGAVAVFTDVYEALDSIDYYAALIASPSSFHVAQAKEVLLRDIPLFIEKPLATSTEGLLELMSLASERKVVTMMGQSYRFHETFRTLKTMLDTGSIGHVYHAHFTGGQYLPDWHPGTDYRVEYAAQKAQGGGVMFTSKSHTLDFIEWFFGPIEELTGWKTRLGSLELDVDDACFLLTKTGKGIVAYAEYDFLQRPHRSSVSIVGAEGTIDADFIAHTITIHTKKGSTETTVLTPDPNEHYLEEMRYFIQLVDDGVSDPTLDIAHGAHIVDLMLDTRVRDLTHDA